MKKIKNKLVIIALGFILILSVGALLILQINNPFYANADTSNAENSNVYSDEFVAIEYDICIDAKFDYTILNDNECSVRISNNEEATRALIDGEIEIDGKMYTVTEIDANGFMSSPNLIRVRVPKTVKTIGNSAFANCPALERINLSNVETIGNSVFNKCTSLQEIVIPKSVSTIGANAFRGDTTIVKVRAENIPEGWSTRWETGSNITVELNYKKNQPLELEREVGYGRSSTFTGYTLAGGQPRTDDFYEVHKNEVTENIENVERDGDNIFIPAKFNGVPIVAIADYAFEEATFNTVVVEYSDQEINLGSNLFSGANGKSVIINRQINFEYDGKSDNTFNSASIETIIIPDNITEIVTNMFSDNKVLKSIQFKAIDENATRNSLLNLVNNEDAEQAEEAIKNEGVVFLTENSALDTINSGAFANLPCINKLHIYDNIKNVNSRILYKWDTYNNVYEDDDKTKPLKQVYVHNKARLEDFKQIDKNKFTGWHPQWNSDFANIEYDMKFYCVKFDTLGGQLNSDINYVYIAENGIIPELPTAFLDDYHIFRGWKDDDGNEFVEGTSFNYVSDLTVHAIYDDKEYNITLDPMGGKGGTELVTGKLGKILPDATQPQKAGFDFVGYSTDKDGNIHSGDFYYIPSEKPSRIMEGKIWRIPSDTTLYAKWSPKISTVEYLGVPDGIKNENEIMTSIYGDATYALKDIEVARGYHFDGWYLNGVKVTSINTEMGSEIKLTAKISGNIIHVSSGSQVVDIRDTYAIIVLPDTLDSSCTINILASVKQVYMYSNNPEYLYKININIAARYSDNNKDFYLLLENVSFQAEYNKEVNNIGQLGQLPIMPYRQTGLAHAINMVYTDVNTCLHLYAYGKVSIKGANGINGSDGKNAIFCQNLYIHYTGDRNDKCTILGGDGSKSDKRTGNAAVAILVDMSLKISIHFDYNNLITCGGYVAGIDACVAAYQINSGNRVQYVDD